MAVGRILAFDWGLKRIGVAVGNGLLGTSEPLCILRAHDGVPNWQEVAQLLAQWQPAQLVVGDPV
ncbi:MAG: Holliday junction resolvase RuvX, partial [Luminiphilus sp.]